jgi:hypothetical protein
LDGQTNGSMFWYLNGRKMSRKITECTKESNKKHELIQRLRVIRTINYTNVGEIL